MKNTELLNKIAHLESINDQLVAEISHLDHLMRILGFSNGLESLKNAAEEVIENDEFDTNEDAEAI